jgi:hypothetical protein
MAAMDYGDSPDRHRPSGAIARRATAGRWMGFQEREELGPLKAALPPATDPEAGEATRVGPAAQRGLADLEQGRRLRDVEQLLVAPQSTSGTFVWLTSIIY